MSEGLFNDPPTYYNELIDFFSQYYEVFLWPEGCKFTWNKVVFVSMPLNK